MLSNHRDTKGVTNLKMSSPPALTQCIDRAGIGLLMNLCVCVCAIREPLAFLNLQGSSFESELLCNLCVLFVFHGLSPTGWLYFG